MEIDKSKVLGVIPARFGSVRFPGKPLAEISGKTLIQRTFENAKRCTLFGEIVVATDDERIAEHVASFGGKAIMTSEECPTGTERIAEAVGKGGFDDVEIVVNVQGDEPTLEPQVIERVITELANDPKAVMSTVVVKIQSEEEANDHHVVKCVIDEDSHALYFSRALIPSGKTGKWREDFTYYKHIGLYGFRREFLLRYSDLEPTPLQKAEDLEQLKVLEHGHKIKVAIVDSEAIGVDTPEDLQKLKKLL